MLGSILNYVGVGQVLSRNYYGYGSDFENFRVVREFFSSFLGPLAFINGSLDRNFRVFRQFFRPIPAYLRSLSVTLSGT